MSTKTQYHGSARGPTWLRTRVSNLWRSAFLSLLVLANLQCGKDAIVDPDNGNNNNNSSPSINVSMTSISFTATAGGADPAAQMVDVTKGGNGTLSGLAASITYGNGQQGGWLNASMSGNAAPATIMVQASIGSLAAGTYNATISVTSGVASNSPRTINVTFTISAASQPMIALSATNLSFTAGVGGANPNSQTVNVTNSGSGTLSGLGTTIAYGSGQPTGWLSANLSNSSAPASIDVQATTGSLAAGTYTATISVASSVSGNSPQDIAVTFMVSAGPLIALSPSSLSFAAAVGGANPASQLINVTNGGGGTLSGLNANLVYGSGQPTGWLSANFNGGTAPTTITMQPSTGSLPAGTYTATISVVSGQAVNSPQSVDITFTVSAGPVIALSATSRTFAAQTGGANPASQSVNVTNSGGGTLNGLGTSIAYGSGSGWLSASLNSSTAPATITIQPTTGGLASGTYTATISVTSNVAVNSPQQIAVTFTVSASPTIGLSATSHTFNAITGGGNPSSQGINVTNTGGGTLTGLGTSIVYQSGQPTGWLTANLNTSTAPATITLQATTGSLNPGVYTATVSVASGVADNSPRTIDVTFVVGLTTPVLSAPSSTTSPFTVTWTYSFTPCPMFCSSNDGYVLEESTTSATSGFATIFNSFNTADRQSPKSLQLTRSVGTYWYRVRAFDASGGGFTPYSNVVQVTVTAPAPIISYATAANFILNTSNVANDANTVYQTGDIGVGCNFVIGTFSDFQCFASLIAFDDIQSAIAGQNVVSATLRLYVSLLPADLATTYAVNAIAGPWNPATVTWNTQPNIWLSPSTLQTNFAPPTTGVVPVELDVTLVVQNWAAGGFTNYGLMLRDLAAVFPSLSVIRLTAFESEDSASPSSRRPQIEVVFGTAPPPGAPAATPALSAARQTGPHN